MGKVKRCPTEWQKIFASCSVNKELITRIIQKYLKNSNTKRINNSMKMQVNWTNPYPCPQRKEEERGRKKRRRKRKFQLPLNAWKILYMLLVGTWIEISLEIPQETKKGTAICSSYSTSGYMPGVLASLLLAICLRESEYACHRCTGDLMFTVVLFTRAKQ